jgi:hypothetical protein
MKVAHQVLFHGVHKNSHVHEPVTAAVAFTTSSFQYDRLNMEQAVMSVDVAVRALETARAHFQAQALAYDAPKRPPRHIYPDKEERYPDNGAARNREAEATDLDTFLASLNLHQYHHVTNLPISSQRTHMTNGDTSKTSLSYIDNVENPQMHDSNSVDRSVNVPCWNDDPVALARRIQKGRGAPVSSLSSSSWTSSYFPSTNDRPPTALPQRHDMAMIHSDGNRSSPNNVKLRHVDTSYGDYNHNHNHNINTEMNMLQTDRSSSKCSSPSSALVNQGGSSILLNHKWRSGSDADQSHHHCDFHATRDEINPDPLTILQAATTHYVQQEQDQDHHHHPHHPSPPPSSHQQQQQQSQMPQHSLSSSAETGKSDVESQTPATTKPKQDASSLSSARIFDFEYETAKDTNLGTKHDIPIDDNGDDAILNLKGVSNHHFQMEQRQLQMQDRLLFSPSISANKVNTTTDSSSGRNSLNMFAGT